MHCAAGMRLPAPPQQQPRLHRPPVQRRRSHLGASSCGMSMVHAHMALHDALVSGKVKAGQLALRGALISFRTRLALCHLAL